MLEDHQSISSQGVSSPPAEPRYRIGTVSRLTGIPTVTLRMWERRYGVVLPERQEGNNRLYSRRDIGRLALIKRLVDEGHAISTLAALSESQLQGKLQFCREYCMPEHDVSVCRVVLCGDALPALFKENGEPMLKIVLRLWDSGQLEQHLADHAVDVLVLEHATLQPEHLEAIERWQALWPNLRMVVVYGFARRSAIVSLEQQGVLTVRAPLGSIDELRRVCLASDPVTLSSQQRIVAPSFSRMALSQLRQIESDVECECPRHLAELLINLGDFEKYSRECIALNKKDAELHARLYRTTAYARTLMEGALQDVLTHEGIQLTSSPP